MNDNVFAHIGEKREQRKICARHPVSVWKEGYRRCYWGFKLQQDCEQLSEKGGDRHMTDFLPRLILDSRVLCDEQLNERMK